VLQANEALLWAKQVKQPHNTSKSYKELVRHARAYWQSKEHPKMSKKGPSDKSMSMQKAS